MGTSIKRDLPNDEYQAAVGANNPSANNVFTTENEVQAGYAVNVNLDPVLDNTVTDPTTLTPDFGDSYIVAVGAVLGDWFGQDNNIATWDGEAWQFYIPSSGDVTTVLTGVNAGSIYEYTTSWNVISAIASNTSPFYLAGSTTDAGGNKTNTIARTGPVTLGSNSGSIGTSPLTVRGNASIENVNTRWRLGFANATTLNNWFRLATFSVPNNSSKNYQLLVNISTKAPNAFVSAVLHITISKNNGSTGKSVCSVVNISGPGISGAGFENFRLEDSNFQFRKYESINAGGTVYRLYYSPTILDSSMSVTVLNNNGGGTSGSIGIVWNNTYLGASIEAPGLGGATDNEAIFNYSGQRTNISAVVDPTVSNDYTEQYTTGSLWYNTATNKLWICMNNASGAALWKILTLTDDDGNVVLPGGLQFGGGYSSATLTANTNNLNIPNIASSSLIRLNATGNFQLTGIVVPDNTIAYFFSVFNVGTSGNIIFKNDDAGSTAQNRFTLGGDVTVQPGEGLSFIYDPLDQKWRSPGKNI